MRIIIQLYLYHHPCSSTVMVGTKVRWLAYPPGSHGLKSCQFEYILTSSTKQLTKKGKEQLFIVIVIEMSKRLNI